jgi:glyoxylase-like metal-dependent hydrolase (beta-lactamase superfamily II)
LQPILPYPARAMRQIDVLHRGREKVIACFEVDGILVDPGPQSCEETLLAALGDERPQALLLTHIHFDHAGAAGALVRRWPDLDVYVHERGARHMANPEKLVASAARLYGGEEGLRETWGEVIPVPEERLKILSGGESVLGFTVAYTPGHASHHVCYLHEDSGTAFVGDMAGVRIPPSGLTLAPTPPPDIDVEAWERSLETIGAWAPERLALTHFGTAEDAGAQLDAVRESLRWQADLAGRSDQDAFMAVLHERIEANAPEDVDAVEQAAPLDHLFLGLDRWHRKRG